MSLLALKSKEAEPLLCLPFHKYFNHKKTRFVFSFFSEKTLLCLGSYLVLTQTYKDRKTMQAGCLHASYTDLHP